MIDSSTIVSCRGDGRLCSTCSDVEGRTSEPGEDIINFLNRTINWMYLLFVEVERTSRRDLLERF